MSDQIINNLVEQLKNIGYSDQIIELTKTLYMDGIGALSLNRPLTETALHATSTETVLSDLKETLHKNGKCFDDIDYIHVLENDSKKSWSEFATEHRQKLALLTEGQTPELSITGSRSQTLSWNIELNAPIQHQKIVVIAKKIPGKPDWQVTYKLGLLDSTREFGYFHYDQQCVETIEIKFESSFFDNYSIAKTELEKNNDYIGYYCPKTLASFAKERLEAHVRDACMVAYEELMACKQLPVVFLTDDDGVYDCHYALPICFTGVNFKTTGNRILMPYEILWEEHGDRCDVAENIWQYSYIALAQEPSEEEILSAFKQRIELQGWTDENRQIAEDRNLPITEEA